LEKRPASAQRVYLSYAPDEIAAHSARIAHIPPEER
jgi:hypothetical protein